MKQVNYQNCFLAPLRTVHLHHLDFYYFLYKKQCADTVRVADIAVLLIKINFILRNLCMKL